MNGTTDPSCGSCLGLARLIPCHQGCAEHLPPMGRCCCLHSTFLGYRQLLSLEPQPPFRPAVPPAHWAALLAVWCHLRVPYKG